MTSKWKGSGKPPLPDWRTGVGYPTLETTSNFQWAWEFLRRNPLYRKDYATYEERSATLRAKYNLDVDGCEPTPIAWDEGDELGYVYDPPRLSGESKDAWLRRVGSGKTMSLGTWLARKWGIDAAAPPDPALPYPAPWWENSRNRVTFGGHGSHGFRSPLVAIQFDLSLPLAPQIEAASKQLQHRQESLVKHSIVRERDVGMRYRRDKYLGYLRILDALEVMGNELSPSVLRDIGEVILPDTSNEYPDYKRDKALRSMIDRARALRDDDYRMLPAIGRDIGMMKK